MRWLSKYRVGAAVGAALVVLAVVFHARLIAWFSGKRSADEFSTPAVTNAGVWKISASIEPDPPKQNGNRLRVLVADAAGKPVDSATVSITYDMPGMAMPGMKGTFDAKPGGSGIYEGAFDLPMAAGEFAITVHAKSDNHVATADYTLTIGTRGLKASRTGGVGGGQSGSGSDVAYWTCSMHPSVHAHEPGKCPICGMDLTPVTNADLTTGVVQLDEARQKAIGVRSEAVAKAAMELEIRAVGKLAFDETRLTDVVLKVGGFVSALRVTAMGQPVKRGEALFQLYSPELFAAQQDYLLARSSQEALGGTGHGEQLVRAAETKLSLLGLSKRQIDAITRSGKPIEKLAFAAPASGYVTEKNVVEGSAIKAGDRVFRIAALDKIWVEADVFEADLPHIAKGQKASIALSYIPNRTFDGEVTFVYPYLDPNARTGRVRIELPNAGLELKPDMYATVMFHVALGERLQLPSAAVMYQGIRRIVIVDLGEGRLVPREIKTGAQTRERTEVVSGLGEGDRVVTTGNFLIAAESRIRSSGAFWKEAP